MESLLTTASQHPNATLVVLGLIWAACYLLACLAFPFKACSWCKGGKHRSASGKTFRACWRCGGSGKVLRMGRRLFHGRSRD